MVWCTTHDNPEGKQGLTFTFNKEKYVKDRDALKGKISDSVKKLEAKFPGMSEKAKNLTGAAKDKWEKLMKKKDDLMGRFKKIESTEDEAAEKARREIEAELQQFEDEFQKTELVPPPASN